MRLQRRLLATLGALALLAPAAASAQSSGSSRTLLAALSGDKTLLTIDTSSRKVTRRVTVQGVGRLLSIDLRVADGKLYGLDADGSVVTIDPVTGKTSPKSQLQTTPPSGVRVNIDFNPVVDRLRIVGEDGTNLRANVDDGTVTVDAKLNFPMPPPGSPDPGTPNVLAAAYTNNFKGTTATLLYDITARDILFVQVPPNGRHPQRGGTARDQRAELRLRHPDPVRPAQPGLARERQRALRHRPRRREGVQPRLAHRPERRRGPRHRGAPAGQLT
jgi:hypothetical protein